MRKSIIVSLNVEGIHCWPDCNLPNVRYLKHPHRHTFGIECRVNVDDSNRQIEFIDFKHRIKQYIAKTYWDPALGLLCDFGHRSCEMIAEELLEVFDLDECRVSEDGEFWGVVAKD